MPLSGSPRSDQHSHLYAAAAWMMRNTLLDQLTFQVRSQQVKWLVDDSIAYHLTLSLDGWSNARMESIYSWNIIFPDRRVMLLRSDDLSSISHTGENLASKAVFMKAWISTKEALDMFSEYYDDDCTKARGMFINNTSIQTGLNFANAVLDPEHVHQPVTPLHATTLGSSSESFDINSLL